MMKLKKYILKGDDVGYLASAVAIQEGKISLEKDTETTFYIATVEGDDIKIPENLKALEMQVVDNAGEPEEIINITEALKNFMGNSDPNSTDLVLRLHLNQNVDPAMFPVLYEEIAKAVDSAIKKMDD